MNTKIENAQLSPPKLIPTLLAGFNTVANNIGLILFPLGLDLLIWFGPQLKLEKLLKPIYAQAIQTLVAYNSSEMRELLESSMVEMEAILTRINLTNNLSTFPIGIPSLLSGLGVENTPIGSPLIYDISSFGSIFFLTLFFLILGFILGCLYLSAIAYSTSKKSEKVTIEILGMKLLKGIGLSIVLILIILILVLPALFVVSLFSLFSPVLSQVVLLISTFVLIWLIIPLIFSPHGIFANNMGIIQSILYSTRVVRSYLPGTGMFLLAAILIAQGLDILWIAAPTDSWLTLIGITGHAFIYTSLIASSFIYYQKSSEWTTELLERIKNIKKV
ncbi:MAG TPA: hypothetical protein VK856_01625 [Anaerolineaceae bacterium]|jgi:hypothetical protein|nr:hypothetical protein [Anaerolineaceae bacterium]